MIQRILAGTTTDADVVEAQGYGFDERKRLMERLLITLADKMEETLRYEEVMKDVANGLKQSRPVFAAGLPVDQALGFITKLVQESLEELENEGAADSDEYEKQELVLEKLSSFIAACESAGTTQGEEAQETALAAFRSEIAKLDEMKAGSEAGIANSLAFLKGAYGESAETEAFVKGLDRNATAMKFVAKFGSPSFFAFKHVGAPGEIGNHAGASE